MCSLNDDVAVVALRTGSRTLNPAKCRRLRAVLRRGELYAETHVGNGIAVRINFDLVQRPGGERLTGCRRHRVHRHRRMHVKDDDRLAWIARSAESIEVCHVQPCVAAWKSKVRTRSMM